MSIQKTTGAILSFAILCTVIAGALPPFTAHAEESEETEEISLTQENAELFLPESYEQYLPLETPSYMSMNGDKIVVADGAKLYLYDKTVASYSEYEAPLQEGTTVSKVQLTEGGRLFFTAGGLFYEYDFTAGAASELPEMACSTFLAVDDYLYSVRSTENYIYLNRYPLDNLTRGGEQPIDNMESSIVPKLSASEGKLYYVLNNANVLTYDITETPKAQTKIAALDSSKYQVPDLQFVCAYQGFLYYTVNGKSTDYVNGLYRTDFDGNATRLIEGDGFSAVDTFGGRLYCIKGASVLELSLTEHGVTYSGYEIASSSSSINRLQSATDAARAGDLLVIADGSAHRVSVYNFSTKAYSILPCDFEPKLVATDGETIAVADENGIYACKYDETALKPAPLSDKLAVGTVRIRALTVLYGEIYYVTSGSIFGKVGDNSIVLHEYGTPIRMTNDLYGNLFVSYDSGEVYTFTESNYLTDSEGVKLEYLLPLSHTTLHADFEGNLYCLAGSTIFKNGKAFCKINGADFVYADAQTKTPTAFALGFEDSEIYFMFGDFSVKSKADVLPLPTLNKISAEASKTATFSVHGTDELFIDVPAGEIGITTNLAAFRSEETEYFPYEGYFRTQKPARGVLLAETDKYCLTVICGEENHRRVYTAALFRKSFCQKAEVTEYFTEKSEGAYLSSSVSSYFVPTLMPELAAQKRERGTYVKVLGFVKAPELTYAYVEFPQNGRSAETGYIPASYLSDVSPAPSAGDKYLTGYLKENKDGVAFFSDDGSKLLVTERTRAKIYEAENGQYLVRIFKNGKSYSATLEKEFIEWNQSDAIRISLIVILTVLALIIIGVYVYLLPRKTK